MDRIKVVSSNIASVGYSVEKKVLEIEFVNETIYRFFDVPLGVHAGLLGARSVGQFFHANIKNKYQFSKLE